MTLHLPYYSGQQKRKTYSNSGMQGVGSACRCAPRPSICWRRPVRGSSVTQTRTKRAFRAHVLLPNLVLYPMGDPVFHHKPEFRHCPERLLVGRGMTVTHLVDAHGGLPHLGGGLAGHALDLGGRDFALQLPNNSGQEEHTQTWGCRAAAHLVDAHGGLPLLGSSLAGHALKLGGRDLAAAVQDDQRALHVKVAAHGAAAHAQVRGDVLGRHRPGRRCLHALEPYVSPMISCEVPMMSQSIHITHLIS